MSSTSGTPWQRGIFTLLCPAVHTISYAAGFSNFSYATTVGALCGLACASLDPRVVGDALLSPHPVPHHLKGIKVIERVEASLARRKHLFHVEMHVHSRRYPAAIESLTEVVEELKRSGLLGRDEEYRLTVSHVVHCDDEGCLEQERASLEQERHASSEGEELVSEESDSGSGTESMGSGTGMDDERKDGRGSGGLETRDGDTVEESSAKGGAHMLCQHTHMLEELRKLTSREDNTVCLLSCRYTLVVEVVRERIRLRSVTFMLDMLSVFGITFSTIWLGRALLAAMTT